MTEPLEYWKRLAESRTENGEEIARENATLKARVEELETLKASFAKVTCAYCYAVHDAPATFEAIQAHVSECPKHPMAEVRAKLHAAEAREAGLREAALEIEGALDAEGTGFAHTHEEDEPFKDCIACMWDRLAQALRAALASTTTAEPRAVSGAEAGLREALEVIASSTPCDCSISAPVDESGHYYDCVVAIARAALASTAEPIHAAPTKEQDNGSDGDVLRVGQEGVRQLSGRQGGGSGGGADGGARRGEQAVVEVHAERLNQDAHHKPGSAESVRAGEGVSPDVRAGVTAPVAADARPGSAAPPAQQPETPHKHDSVLAETVCLGCQWEKINAVEAERDALKKQLEEAEASRERFRNWYEDKAKYNTTLQLDRNTLRTERDALREKLEAQTARENAGVLQFDNLLARERAEALALRERLSRAREWTEDDVERVISDAQAAITTTLDNEARAVSKGSAPYADAFRRAALANNVADAIASVSPGDSPGRRCEMKRPTHDETPHRETTCLVCQWRKIDAVEANLSRAREALAEALEAFRRLQAKVCEQWCCRHPVISTSHHPDCDQARAAIRALSETPSAPNQGGGT